jgi:nucleotide-binding universal stress UspA family protein
MKSLAKIEERLHGRSSGRGRAFRGILVPTDFAPRSERAVNYGVELARQLEAHLTLLHVVPAPFAIDYTLGGIPGAEWERVRNRADKKLDAALNRAKLRYEPVDALVRVGSDLHQEIVSATRRRRSKCPGRCTRNTSSFEACFGPTQIQSGCLSSR